MQRCVLQAEECHGTEECHADQGDRNESVRWVFG